MAERWTPAYDRIFDPEHELAGDTVCRRFAWLDLCHMAQWKDGARILGSTVVPLQKGELVASLRFLAERWGWSRKKVSNYLDILQDPNVAKLETVRETPKGTVYRLVTYGEYANPGTGKEPPLEPPTPTQPETPRETPRETDLSPPVRPGPQDRGTEKETPREPSRSHPGATREPGGSQVGAKEQQVPAGTAGTNRDQQETAAAGAGEGSDWDGGTQAANLADWMGAHGADVLDNLSGYTQAAMFGLVGPRGTREDAWGEVPEPERPSFMQDAIQSYLAAKNGDRWHRNFFLSVVEGVARDYAKAPPGSEAAGHAGRDETHELEAERARTLREQAEAKSRAEEKRLNAEGEKAARQAQEARAWYEDQPPEVQQQVDQAAERRLQALGFRGSPGTVPKVLQATALVKAIQEIRQEATV